MWMRIASRIASKLSCAEEESEGKFFAARYPHNKRLSHGIYNVVETDGMVDNDESVYFDMIDENPSTEIGMYTADFTVNSMAEMDGCCMEFFCVDDKRHIQSHERCPKYHQ